MCVTVLSFSVVMSSSTHKASPFQRVYAGGYAYVTDVTSTLIELEKHCDLAKMVKNFYPSQYACGAQKNSAYTAPISDV